MRLRLLLTSLLLSALAIARDGLGADASASWAGKVRPLLDVHCVKCHGPLEHKGGLELDTLEAVLKGGDEGAVVVPGSPEKSRIYLALAPGTDPHMPPKKQLTEAERETVREWVAAMPATDPALTAKTAPRAMQAPRVFATVEAAIDTWVAEGWERRPVVPAAPVDDRTWCRRVYLDLAGRIPTSAESAAFLQAPGGPDRRTLVEALLASDAYPVRMRELWDVFLMGRPKRDNHEDRRRQNGWWAFLEDAFRSERPWDETVRRMLVARPETEADRGASWFLYERRNDHQAIAEAVAPVVYGTRIDCAQCHDHPLAREIKQGHYWGLVAAFNRSKNIDGGSSVAESAVGGFVNFTNLKKESQPAVVTLLGGRSVEEKRPAEGEKPEDRDDLYVDSKAKARVPKSSRREAFADAATRGNALLARAFVNRMWAAFLGRGIVHPADEMNARNVPSHPELLDWLAQDFASHRHDIRRLVRGMVLSRPYGLGATEALPEAFAGASERPLSAEQLARSWRVAAGLAPDEDALRKAVVGAIPEVMPKDYNATFQQAQFLTRSPALGEILKPTAFGTVARLAALPDPAARVREAFLAAHDRLPDADEAAQAVALLTGRSDAPADGVRDLLWALLTSAESLTMP